MFSRLLIARLKTAEHALRDGRLDEAYRLACAADLRTHRRGAAVLASLTDRFFERARSHFQADRFAEALADLGRAERCGGQEDEIAELRKYITAVASEQQRQGRSRRDRIDQAKQRIEDGSLTAGRRILNQAGPNDRTAQDLRKLADNREDEAAGLVEQAERLLSQGRQIEAAQRLLRAKRIDANNETVTRLETQLCQQVLEQARSMILEGKLNRASEALAGLGELGKALSARQEQADMFSLAKETAVHVQSARYAEAIRSAMSLERLLPKAQWVRDAVARLRHIDDNITALGSGPLGECMGEGGGAACTSGAIETLRPPRPAQIAAQAAKARCSGELPDRLLLLIEGGGSYLILRSDRASLGRAACDDPADIPLIGDMATHHADIQRVEEDYFLFSGKEVEVAGRRTRHQLLHDGDRIVLGRSAKLTFRKPSRRSPSAVLDLSDTTRMPNDVRRIILFDRHVGVGPGSNAHIPCRQPGRLLVLYERARRLWIRRKDDGHVDTDPVELRLGEPTELAGLNLVLRSWASTTPGDSTIGGKRL